MTLLRHLPNLITVVRLLLVGPVVWMLVRGEYLWALGLFLVAGLSDALDGLLARSFNWFSRFGAIADPIADKLLLVSTSITLGVVGLLPLWLVALLMVRDLVILAGAITYHVLIGPYAMAPSILGKLCTFTQIAYVLMVISHAAGLALPVLALEVGVWIVAGITVASGLHYVLLWGTRFFVARRRRR